MSKWVITEEHYKRLNEIQQTEQDLLGKLSELNKERIQIYKAIVELANPQESQQKNDADAVERETQAESDLLKLRELYETSKKIHKEELDDVKEEYERAKEQALAELTKKNQEEIEKLKKANEETIAKIKADLVLQKQQEEEQERKRRRLAEKREKAKAAAAETPKAVVESTPAAAAPAAAVESTPVASTTAEESTTSQEDEERKKKEEEVRLKREALEKMKAEAQQKRESRIQELERLKKEKEQLAERKVGGSMVVRPTTSRPAAFSIFENGGKSPETTAEVAPPAASADAAPAEVVTCFTCKEPIKGIQQIKACGNSYHRLCFKCSHEGCTKFIGATTFVPVDNKPYCRDHAPKPDAPAPAEGEKKVSPFAHLFNRGAAAGAANGSGASPFADGVPAAKSSRSVIVRPSSAAARFGSAQEKCTVCAKTVYAIEKLVADEKVFHKSCFQCNQCNKVLKLGNYASLEGNYYCKPHFKQLFMSKGNYSEGFGKKKLTLEWSEKNNKEVTPVII